MVGWIAALAALTLPGAPLMAQTGYKYRDADGHWVFTDQAAPSGAPAESFNLGHQDKSLHFAVERVDDGDSMQLIAVNGCLCPVTMSVAIIRSGFPTIADGAEYHVTLEPGTRQTVVRAPSGGTEKPGLGYLWKAVIGSPEAVHSPSRPYRAPFGVGSTYLVSQAYPSQVTHNTAESRYAVDIALPDGTPVYAAREGLVINERHDSFHGAIAPVMLDQANVVEILHDDGTIAVYAHLRWDSIRVRIGVHVARGQYIADSGNTGFSSGPHLHFAVIRNTGVEEVSIPIQFAGLAGAAVTPENQMPLTAY